MGLLQQHIQAMKNLSILFLFSSFFFHTSLAADTISQSQSLSEGITLVSEDGSFELGFFTPGSTQNRYLGIWYKRIRVKIVVWVANRANPVKHNNSTMFLHINSEGNLVLVNNHNETPIRSTNSTNKNVKNPILQLLNSENLVLRDESENNNENYLWQSFDYPSDTLLPGMKLGWDFKKLG